MRKKPAIPPLPPLSLKTLRDVETIEEFAQGALRRSNSPSRFNFAKALQALRTCVVSAFDTKTAYYRSLPDFRKEWIADIGAETISSALGLIPDLVRDEDIREMEGKLCDTLNEHLRGKTETQPQTPTQQSPRHTEPISKQLDDLRKEGRLTVEQLAEGTGVTWRSVYRHLSGEVIPRTSHIASYEKFFSEKLRRPVRLENVRGTSGKSVNVSKMSG